MIEGVIEGDTEGVIEGDTEGEIFMHQQYTGITESYTASASAVAIVVRAVV